jgi:UDP-N-acetylmuramate--alanine ligase
MAFDLFYKECHYREIQVPLIGQHNALNACSVFVMALLLGAKEEAIKQALSTFAGVHRRADKLAEVSGVRFYDDYGHHPTEVEATIKAFKDSLPNDRLITVFQPHRYTRTRDCFEQFIDAFRHSDVLVLTDLYAASEEPIEGVSSETLYHRIQKKYGENIFYIRKDILPEFLEHFVRPSDVVLTMGAGDVTKIGPLVAGRLHE